MSRIGKLPISLNSKVNVDFKDGLITIKGPKGTLEFKVPGKVKLEVNKENLRINDDFSSIDSRIIGGTVRSILANMVEGVTTGFTTILNLVGVGYRAQVAGQKLTLVLGYSHPIDYQLHKLVSAQVDGTKITLTSCDKQTLGQTVAEIRKYRPPEPYKGKGILIENERLRRKAGKAGKASK